MCFLSILLGFLMFPLTSQALTTGDQGKKVYKLNQQLERFGYLPQNFNSSYYGEETYHGVMAAQKWLNIARDGIAGPQTLKELKRLRRPHVRYPDLGIKGKHIEIHLSKQLVYLIRKGKTIRTISTSTGSSSYTTPQGTWKVYLKNPNAYSYQYNAPMPWSSFYSGGYALHASSNVPGYPASHGCSRIPNVFAEKIYKFATMGTTVSVTW